MSAVPLAALASTGRWQQDFVRILPAIQTHASIRFRKLPPQRKEDAVAESVAVAAVNYQRLAAAGRLNRAYVSSLAGFSVRHAAQDRRIGGRQSSGDVLSPLAQKKHGFAVSSLNNPHDYYGLRPRIIDRGDYTPADAAAFRIDFERWLNDQCGRDRRIIRRLIGGDGTGEVARRFGLSEGRVSQLRRKFERGWAVFQRDVMVKPSPNAKLDRARYRKYGVRPDQPLKNTEGMKADAEWQERRAACHMTSQSRSA